MSYAWFMYIWYVHSSGNTPVTFDRRGICTFNLECQRGGIQVYAYLHSCKNWYTGLLDRARAYWSSCYGCLWYIETVAMILSICSSERSTLIGRTEGAKQSHQPRLSSISSNSEIVSDDATSCTRWLETAHLGAVGRVHAQNENCCVVFVPGAMTSCVQDVDQTGTFELPHWTCNSLRPMLLRLCILRFALLELAWKHVCALVVDATYGNRFRVPA